MMFACRYVQSPLSISPSLTRKKKTHASDHAQQPHRRFLGPEPPAHQMPAHQSPPHPHRCPQLRHRLRCLPVARQDAVADPAAAPPPLQPRRRLRHRLPRLRCRCRARLVHGGLLRLRRSILEGCHALGHCECGGKFRYCVWVLADAQATREDAVPAVLCEQKRFGGG